jgi:lysophosphatidate acyltransferase
VYLSNTVFINRANHSSALQAFETAAKHMQDEKQSVFIFPEGTRSYSAEPTLLPFKKGGFHLAVQAQVPIVPVVCANYASILSFKRLYFHGGRIPVRVLRPVDTRGLGASDVDDLMKFVREEMLSALRDMHARPVDGVGVLVEGTGKVGNGGVVTTATAISVPT